MSDKLLESIAEIRRMLDEKVSAIKSDPKMEEIIKVHGALNSIEDLLGEPQTSLADVFKLPSDQKTSEPKKIAVDTFLGLDGLGGAKRLLKMENRAMSFKEIVKMLRNGGCQVGQLEKLQLSLGRANQIIVKIGADHYGLLENYPELQKARKKRSSNGAPSGVVEHNPSSDNEQEGDEINRDGENNEDINDLV